VPYFDDNDHFVLMETLTKFTAEAKLLTCLNNERRLAVHVYKNLQRPLLVVQRTDKFQNADIFKLRGR